MSKHYYFNENRDNYLDNFYDILALHSIGDYTRIFPEILQSIKFSSYKQVNHFQNLEDHYLPLEDNIKIVETYYNHYFPTFMANHVISVLEIGKILKMI